MERVVETRVANDTIDQPLRSYLQVVLSFKEGLLRIWGAEAAYARLILALTTFHALGRPGLDGPAAEVLRHLEKIRFSSFESMEHVTDMSHLVYAASLFDSFLSDTTVFLFLLIPQAMGKKQQISLHTLIEASSKTVLISELAVARSREIAYLPIAGRLQYLRDTFGLRIAIDDETLAAISDLAAKRNEAVHDQSIIKLQLEESGVVSVRPRTLTKLEHQELHKSIGIFHQVARAVYDSVFKQVLKASDHPAVSNLTSSAEAEPKLE
jgi:hypothetical protein